MDDHSFVVPELKEKVLTDYLFSNRANLNGVYGVKITVKLVLF